MLSRRQIREAVLQFLYSFDLEGGGDPAEMRDAFWEFVTESDRKALLTTTVRAVKHLALGRGERVDSLMVRAEKARGEFGSRPEAEPLFEKLDTIRQMESKWSMLFDQLERELREVGESSSGDLERILGELFATDRGLEQVRKGFFLQVEEVPEMKGRMEPVVAAIRRLQRISDRIRMIENPEQFPEQADLGKIRESKADLIELRTRVDQTVDGLLAARIEIDEALAGVIENYTPERIDPVDRAILRLACYEARHGGTPVNVAINEAIELAKRFGTTDSPRFVNGVLDKVMNSPV